MSEQPKYCEECAFRVFLCPKHAAVDALVEALQSTLRSYESATCNHPDDAVREVVIKEAHAALALVEKAEGKV